MVTTDATGRTRNPPHRGAITKKAKQRFDLYGPPTPRRLLDLPAGTPRVKGMDVHRNVPLTPQLFGKTDMVRVTVGQNQRPDIVERASHRGKLTRQSTPIPGQAGINDRHQAAVLNQVTIDQPRAQPKDRSCDLITDPQISVLRHDAKLPSWSAPG